MTLAAFLAEVWIMIPVVFLFAIGFGITVQSGGGGNLRVTNAMGNLTKTIAVLAVCLALVIAAQSFAGYRMGLNW